MKYYKAKKSMLTYRFFCKKTNRNWFVMWELFWFMKLLFGLRQNAYFIKTQAVGLYMFL